MAKSKKMKDKFDFTSPTVFRYLVDDLTPYFSEQAYVNYKSKVEAELAKLLAKKGNISEASAREIERASRKVKARDVYEREEITKHDIIAQVDMIKKSLDKRAEQIKKKHSKKPDPDVDEKLRNIQDAKCSVHRAATSYDIVDTANAMRYRDAFYNIILPDLIKLEKSWIKLAEESADVLQIGRTHLQHAEPITFGFAMACYVDRLGKRIYKIKEAVDDLYGKFSGAVGAYNASSLFFDDPEDFEKELMEQIGLQTGLISTQIVQPEPVTDLMHYVTSTLAVLGNWADDMRNLQRPEIAEVGQPRGDDISRSSTMPHKANPVGLENIKSLYKKQMPSMITLYMDQISDHQRDLTNSASQRYIPESFDLFDYAVRRANRISKNLKPHVTNMKKNFDMSGGRIMAEPLHLLLASYGFPDSHGYVAKLADTASATGKPLIEVAMEDPSVKEYISRFTDKQREILGDPEKYTGIASQKAKDVCKTWSYVMEKFETDISQRKK